jgi:ankyrin repeat protein
MEAVNFHNREAAGALVQAGANLNAQDPKGRTPLILAIELGHKEIAQLLLGRGADPTLSMPDGSDALSIAVASSSPDGATLNRCDPDMVKMLLAARPSLRIKDDTAGTSAIAKAKALGCTSVLSMVKGGRTPE